MTENVNEHAPTATAVEEKPEAKGELKLLALLFIISAALFADSLNSEGFFQGNTHGPGSIPQLVSLMVMVMVAGIAISDVRRGYKDGTVKELLSHLFDREVVILLVAVVLYGLLVEILHFIPTTLVFLISTMYLLDKKNPVKKIIISVATVAVLVLIFSTIFQVVLP